MTNYAAIEKMLGEYFDVMHTQDMVKFDRVFNENVTLYSAQSGELNKRPFDVYREAVVNRESPQSKGEARNEKILMIDIRLEQNVCWLDIAMNKSLCMGCF